MRIVKHVRAYIRRLRGKHQIVRRHKQRYNLAINPHSMCKKRIPMRMLAKRSDLMAVLDNKVLHDELGLARIRDQVTREGPSSLKGDDRYHYMFMSDESKTRPGFPAVYQFNLKDVQGQYRTGEMIRIRAEPRHVRAHTASGSIRYKKRRRQQK